MACVLGTLPFTWIADPTSGFGSKPVLAVVGTGQSEPQNRNTLSRTNKQQSFEYVINIKIIDEVFYIFPSPVFILTAHLNSECPYEAGYHTKGQCSTSFISF